MLMYGTKGKQQDILEIIITPKRIIIIIIIYNTS